MAPRRAAQSGSGQSSAGDTRAALIAAGLKIFGQRGFDAASTREIAAAAKTNIGSIAYHFGSKEGLRQACADEIVARIGAVVQPETLIAGAATPEAALSVIELSATSMAQFVAARPEADDIVAFMLREMTSPSPALERIYGELIGPVHRALCRLWALATGGEAESERTRLTVFSIIGQVVYFRIGRPLVSRRMEWDAVGPDEAGAIASVLIGNIRAMARAAREANR